MIRGSWERRGGDKMEEEKGGREDGMRERKGTRMVRGDGDAGNGGRVSEWWWWWWVMKYSVRVCLWLLPSFFFLSTSLADSFIYWGPCGSRNSFAVVLPLHTKRTTGGR